MYQTVIGTFNDLPIGHRGKGLRDDHGRYWPDVSFRVIGVATFDDYLAQAKRIDAPDSTLPTPRRQGFARVGSWNTPSAQEQHGQ